MAAYRLVGYENRDITDNSFTDPGVDAGAIGAGHTATALYAIRLRGGVSDGDRLATVRLRWADPEDGRTRELAREVTGEDLARSFTSTDPHFRFDAIVAATAEVLRDSRFAGRTDLADILRVADEESGGLPATDEVHGFLDLLDAAARLED